MLHPRQTIRLVLFLSLCGYSAFAQTFVINGPTGSEKFGHSVAVLKNGNYVITDPFHDEGGVNDVGAVYLYNGITHALISRLTGSSANDQVGLMGVTILPNGDYVVRSPNWKNGAAEKAGALTQINGATGIAGIVNVSNSLVGSSANDQVGLDSLTLIGDSKYVVRIPLWDNGTTTDAGAVILINSASFVPGSISAANSLVGSHISDKIGEMGLTILKNGNFVVRSPHWDNNSVPDVGAVTFVNVILGLTGEVSETNSLVGATIADNAGAESIVELTNGNYVVKIPLWNGGSVDDVGAVTLCSGETGMSGTISQENSLTGSAENDRIGSGGIAALTNGNYVVMSPLWNNAAIADAGAATWASGTTGILGEVSTSNSLVGSTKDDNISSGGIAVLTNGNYVVVSPLWNNGSLADAGAVTWGNGSSGTVGAVTTGNSLVGSTATDQIGGGVLRPIVRALSDGNYVIASPLWDNGNVKDVGAVTWADGSVGITGTPSAANSIIGSHAEDQVGKNGVFSINGGGYVILSPQWDRGSIVDAGAATMVKGSSPWVGSVGVDNSLVGNTDITGVGSGFTGLANGSFVLEAIYQENYFYRSVFTWWDPMTILRGEVATDNSLLSNTPLKGVAVNIGTSGQWIIEWRSVATCGGCGSSIYAYTWNGGTKETNIVGWVNGENSFIGGNQANLESVNEVKVGFYSLNDQSYLMVGGGGGEISSLITWGNKSGSVGNQSSCIVDETPGYGPSYNLTYNFSFSSADKYVVLGYWPQNRVKIFYPDTRPLNISNIQTSKTIAQNGNVSINDQNCFVIANIHSIGENPVSGKITFQNWIENQVPTFGGVPYVARHYQIAPEVDPNTSTARITLYFTQKEFNDFNDHAGSTLNLPSNANDADGKSYLRITKVSGVSTDETGLPGTFGSGTSTLINPEDEDVIWNETLQRWEVSFDVTGFSGFFVHTNQTPLPVRLISFKATASEADARLNWEIADAENFSHFEIERSVNVKSFETVARIAWTATGTKFDFTDKQALVHGEQLYYRLKMIDLDGTFAYSRIEVVKFDKSEEVKVYPNPFSQEVTVQLGNRVDVMGAVSVYSQNGALLFTRDQQIEKGTLTLNLKDFSVPSGVYLICIRTGQKAFYRRLVKM